MTATVRKRLRGEDGITITEMLVVLAILGVILAGMTTLFLSASTTQIDQTSRVQAQQQARLALDALRREIHCANKVLPDSLPSGGDLITVTLGPYCPKNGSTTTTLSLTIPPSGTYQISAADTSAFAAVPGTIFVGTSSGTITCTAKTASNLTGCTGGVAGTYLPPSAVTGNTLFTWCTKDKNGLTPPAAASSPYSLWRYRGSLCTGTGRKWADYLTETTAAPPVPAGKIFVGYPAVPSGELRVLHIGLPVDVTPGDNKQRYTLRDDIVLRNSPRTP